MGRQRARDGAGFGGSARRAVSGVALARSGSPGLLCEVS